MAVIATGEVASTARPQAFFALWADVATWPQWNENIEWVHLDGPFAESATGAMKPRRGNVVRFVVARLDPDREFTRVSRLPGARLTVRHLVTAHGEGCTVTVEVSLTGPMARAWGLFLARGLRASQQRNLERLARAAEGASTA